MSDPRYRTAEWTRLRRAVFNRDDYKCTRCEKRGQRLECDHIVPVAAGGAFWDTANLRTLCSACHILVTRAYNTRNAVQGQAEWEEHLGAR